MVRHLDDVRAGRPPGQQHGLGLRLDVAGEQGAHRPRRRRSANPARRRDEARVVGRGRVHPSGPATGRTDPPRRPARGRRRAPAGPARRPRAPRRPPHGAVRRFGHRRRQDDRHRPRGSAPPPARRCGPRGSASRVPRAADPGVAGAARDGIRIRPDVDQQRLGRTPAHGPGARRPARRRTPARPRQVAASARREPAPSPRAPGPGRRPATSRAVAPRPPTAGGAGRQQPEEWPPALRAPDRPARHVQHPEGQSAHRPRHPRDRRRRGGCQPTPEARGERRQAPARRAPRPARAPSRTGTSGATRTFAGNATRLAPLPIATPAAAWPDARRPPPPGPPGPARAPAGSPALGRAARRWPGRRPAAPRSRRTTGRSPRTRRTREHEQQDQGRGEQRGRSSATASRRQCHEPDDTHRRGPQHAGLRPDQHHVARQDHRARQDPHPPAHAQTGHRRQRDADDEGGVATR